MKKLITTLMVTAVSVPIFAFDFDNLKINADINTEINSFVNQEINKVAEESAQVKSAEQNQDNEIVIAIKEKMQEALEEINRNTKLRRNIFTRSFIEEQKVQKRRYQNMIRQDVPTQIYEYIEMNFDLPQIKNLWVVCIHHNETIVEVRFTFASHYAIVYYDYNDEQNHIKQIVD